MTAPSETSVDSATLGEETTETRDASAPRRGLAFWIARYLPAEIVGTAALVIGGLVVATWTDNPALVALGALVGETVGFYAVLAVTIYLEQSSVTAKRRRAIARTAMLLIAEFGAAELLDTLLIRPAALMLGVWLVPDPVWGMLAGKIAADIVFYAIAAGAFTLTAKTGLRDRSRRHEVGAGVGAAPIPTVVAPA